MNIFSFVLLACSVIAVTADPYDDIRAYLESVYVVQSGFYNVKQILKK